MVGVEVKVVDVVDVDEVGAMVDVDGSGQLMLRLLDNYQVLTCSFDTFLVDQTKQ